MEEKKIAISKDVLNFLTGIYYEDNEDENIRKKKIFDRAFNMAYKDMATHTVAYLKDKEEYKKYIEGDSKRAKKNRDNIKSAIENHIKSSFVNEDNYSLTNLLAIKDPEDFNKWHSDVCKRIVDINCVIKGLEAVDKTKSEVEISKLLGHMDKKESRNVFTYGQAQKLVNMMLKYLYIYYQCEGWDDLEKLRSFFHVPIDSYVLKAAFDRNDKYNEKAWSKFDDYEKDYMSCQKEIEEFVKEKKKYPNDVFSWELTKWPFGMNL